MLGPLAQLLDQLNVAAVRADDEDLTRADLFRPDSVDRKLQGALDLWRELLGHGEAIPGVHDGLGAVYEDGHELALGGSPQIFLRIVLVALHELLERVPGRKLGVVDIALCAVAP